MTLQELSLENLEKNYAGMLELVNHYKGVRPIEHCPLCIVNTYKDEDGYYGFDCRKCPWAVFTNDICEEYFAVFWFDELSNKSYYDRNRESADSNILHISEARSYRPKLWVKRRLKQLEEWIEVYSEEIDRRTDVKKTG